MTDHAPRRNRSPLPHLAIVLIAVAGAGCTMTTNEKATNSGTIRAPGTLPAPAQTPPPPAAAPGPSGPPPSGNFAGTARLNSRPGTLCRQELPIRTFTVTGDRVRFQSFRGTIQPGGFLEMQAGPSFISGSFQGGRFVGSYWQPHPGCTYDLDLNHVG